MKICLVGSSGGHLKQLYLLEDFWRQHERIWVTFDKKDARHLLRGETFFSCYYPANRNPISLLINSWLALKILIKERPDLLISTGAAVAVPFFYVGKILGAKTIFIEVFDRVDQPTLTGRLVYPICDLFLVQWAQLGRYYKKALMIGGIFK